MALPSQGPVSFPNKDTPRHENMKITNNDNAETLITPGMAETAVSTSVLKPLKTCITFKSLKKRTIRIIFDGRIPGKIAPSPPLHATTKSILFHMDSQYKYHPIPMMRKRDSKQYQTVNIYPAYDWKSISAWLPFARYAINTNIFSTIMVIESLSNQSVAI